MRVNDIITEIFDRKWSLEVTDISQHVYADLKSKGLGHGGLFVWSKANEPHQIIILVNNSGYWEVHHAVRNDSGEFVSGERLDISSGGSSINTGLFATAIYLYKQCLERGRRIRVTAPPELWKPYNAAIEKLLRDYGGRLMATPTDENFKSLDGQVHTARTLRLESKKINISPL